MEVVVDPCKVLLGEVNIPGDKSLSHRSVMVAALADTPTHISGFLPGLDARASLAVIQKIGIAVDLISPTELLIHGQGMHTFAGLISAQDFIFDFQNAGTGIRLFSGLLASTSRQIILTGDASLCRRPMKRITEPLRKMGVDIFGSESATDINFRPSEEYAPLSFNSHHKNQANKPKLNGINYVLPQPSAQVKSCLLLAGLFAEGTTIISEPIQTRDHTERMLQHFGVNLKKQDKNILIEKQDVSKKIECLSEKYEIAKDFSSAAFYIVAGLIAKQGEVVLRKIGLNPTRTGLLAALLKMGGDIRVSNQRFICGEPVGDLVVTNKNTLSGIHVSSQELALMIDEFPIFLLAALQASAPTTIEGIEELAYKESNRIESMVQGLSQLGAKIEVDLIKNKLTVHPLDSLKSIKQASRDVNIIDLDSMDDHRIAMSFFMVSLLIEKTIKVKNIENINTSFPQFFEEAKKIGFCFKIITNQGGVECLQ